MAFLILIFTLIFLIIISIGTYYFSNIILHPISYDSKEYIKTATENNHFDSNFLDSFKNETIYLDSDYKYKLHGTLYHNTSNNFIVICHGIRVSHLTSLKYIEMFLKKGFNVIIYDHRNHGKNDKNFTSFGYYEKYDAQLWVDYIYSINKKPLVGLHGESMGASIALQLATIDNRIAFCIADCGYSNLYKLFKYRVSIDYNKAFTILTKLSNYYIKFKYKWSFDDVSVENFINKATCPILFIHGEDDKYIPIENVYNIYNIYKNNKMLYISKNSKHATSFLDNKKKYTEVVYNFLDKFKILN